MCFCRFEHGDLFRKLNVLGCVNECGEERGFLVEVNQAILAWSY